MRKRYPLGPWVPDELPLGDVLTVACNVFPAKKGYRAAPAFQSQTDSIPATFNGGASFISTSGTSYLLAGTTNGLARLVDGEWASLLVALTVTRRWRFTQFGDFAIAVNSGATQEVDLNAGTASELTDAPTAIDTNVVGDHVVYAQPNGDILKVRWSAFNDHTGNELGTNQAGEQIMLIGGEVMGIAGGEYGVVLQRQRLVRMNLTGDASAPFAFDEITNNFGCASKASITQAGRTVFFLSDRGFVALDDGQQIRPIGNEVFDVYFRSIAAADDYERIWSAVDPTRSIVMWGIPGSPGIVLVYNWVLDRASVLKLNFEGLFSGFANSTSLEGLDATYPSIDDMPYSLDDPRFSGGNPRLYFIAGNELGTLSGANMPAETETGQFALGGENNLRIRAIWPDTDATSGVTVTLDARQRKGDAAAVRASSSMQESGRIPLRHKGRWVTTNIKIDSPDWTYLNAFEVEASAGGDRG